MNSAVEQSLPAELGVRREGPSYLLASRVARLVPPEHAGGLDDGPCQADVAHLPGVEPPHLGALVGDAVGDALGDQDRECLAHGGTRDAQGVGQGHLTQRRTGSELAVEQ